MHLLIVDTETSGLVPGTDHLIEVAVAVFSVEHLAITKARSFVVRAPGNEAIATNRIPVAIVQDERAASQDQADAAVEAWARGCDAILAHSADFDRAWFAPKIQALPWVDTMEFRWPSASTSQSLVAIALAHGLGVGSAHRALEDVLLLSRLITRAAELGMNVEEEVRRGLRPRARFVVSATNFDEARNALAKENGFRWDAPSKRWARTMAREDAASLPFDVREVA